MIAIDKLLLKIVKLPPTSLLSVPIRDLKVLKSLAKIVATPAFITENQSRLLLKILRENSENFSELNTEVTDAILAPIWSAPFRPVDKTKKIFLSPDEPEIVIEFAYSTEIRKVIQSIWKDLLNVNQSTSNRFYKASLTEKNIVLLVETFQPLGFEIDAKIMEFYETIKSWSEIEIKSQFLIENFDHANFQKQVAKDIGFDTPVTDNIMFDRRLRYQYFMENTEKSPENLTEKIAYRKNTKVWVDKKEHTLSELLNSLSELKRFPVMFIFDHNDQKKCLEEMKNLRENLEKMEIYENVGIYFRLPNDENGSAFNRLIGESGYNAQLDENTKIVGVQNGKIPKFFLKNAWKPMTVISIGIPLKQTKTAVYANFCDLIISYSDQEPIIENRVLWE